jgi:hypothetical protein
LPRPNRRQRAVKPTTAASKSATITQLTGLPLEYFARMGELEDYPEQQALAADGHGIGAELLSFAAAVQHAAPESQRLIISQLECLVSNLTRADAP